MTRKAMNRALTAMIITLAAIHLVGCRPAKVIQVPRVEYRDSVRMVVKSDSVYIRDSVYIHDKGDTIRVERWRYRDVWRLRVDTITTTKVDTITAVVEVERQPTTWERVRLGLFPWLMAIAIIAVFYVAIKIWNIFK